MLGIVFFILHLFLFIIYGAAILMEYENLKKKANDIRAQRCPQPLEDASLQEIDNFLQGEKNAELFWNELNFLEDCKILTRDQLTELRESMGSNPADLSYAIFLKEKKIQ